MKKRVLSLILAAVMLLTAFPLFALTALAGEPSGSETEAETVFDYNSLYVKGGLMLLMDYYDSNAFWADAGAGKTYAFPKAVHEWTYRDGAQYAQSALTAQGIVFPTEETDPQWDALLFPEESDRVVTGTNASGGQTVSFTPAFSAAANAYRTYVDEVLNRGVSLRTGAYRPTHYTPGAGPNSWNDSTGIYADTNYLIRDGYIQFAPELHSNIYLTYGAASDLSGTRTVQYVMAPGTRVDNNLFLFRGTSVQLANAETAGEYTLIPGTYNNNLLSWESEVPSAVSFRSDAVAAFTLEVTHPAAVDGTAPGAISMRYNEERVFSAPITYKNPTNTVLGTSIINYSQSTNASVYALRIYDRSLTDDEILLNHFADICKWYRLNPGMYTSLSADERVQAAAIMSDVQVGETAATAEEREALRAALQAELTATVKEIYYDALCVEDTSALCESFRLIAQRYDADIDQLLSLPVEHRTDVYSAVLSMSGEYTTERVNAVIQEAINSIINRYYKDYILNSTLTYKDLYVRKDRLHVWIDFFAARAIDGNIYTDVSYPDETANNAKEDRNTISYSNTTTPARNDMEMFSKYVYKNVDQAFSLYDIIDAGWAHTNIRAYGDGFLDCGKNNSLMVRSPGSDSDVTYQFVMDIDPDKASESASFQLDGFRSSFTRRKSNNAGTIAYPNYYSFGGWSADRSAVAPNNAAILTATPRPGDTNSLGTVIGSKDVTLTIDKRVGTDAGHYYRVEYDQDADGRIACKFYLTEADVKALKEAGEFASLFEERKLGSTTVYRYKNQEPIDGRVFGSGVEAEEADALYLRRGNRAVSESKTETVYYLTYRLNNITTALNDYFYPYPQENGTVLYKSPKGNAWVKAEDDGVKTVYTDAAGIQVNFVTNFINNDKIQEVYENLNDDGVFGPISYYGRMTFSAYADGNLCYSYPDLPYQNNEVGSIGNGAALKIYAIRTYDCVLTAEEIRQNHFADLAGYYRFDLTFFELLNDSQRAELYNALTSLSLGGDHEAANARYKEALSEILYTLGSDTEAANHFLQICKTFSLDINSLLSLSPTSRERVFEAFASVDPSARNFTAILQKMLEEEVTNELYLHYAEATIHNLIRFNGWELRTKNDPAMRARFTVSQGMIDLMKARGYTVRAGVVTVLGNGNNVTVSLNGDTVTGPDGSHVSLVYDGTAFASSEEEVDALGMRFYAAPVVEGYTFAEEIYPDSENYIAKYASVGFVILSKNGEEDIVYTLRSHLRNSVKDSYSMADISIYAQGRRNWSYETIHAVLAETLDDYEYLPAVFGNHSISDLRVSADTLDIDTLATLNALMRDYTGSVFATEAAQGAGRGIMFIGSMDTIYTGRYYGVTVQNGNLYLWYNDQRDAQNLIDLFAEIIATASASESGDVIYLPEGFTMVRKYRAPAESSAE